MQKKVLQDIHTSDPGESDERPNRKWDYGGGNDITKMTSDEEAEDEKVNTPEDPYYGGAATRSKRSGSKFSPMWWGVAGVVGIFFVVIFVWSFFSTATVRVVLSQQTTTVNDTFSAVRNTTEDGVPYQIVKLEEKATADVTPTGEDEVIKKASGQIVIYSEYGDSMRFVVNTRFQAPDGKIYRVDKPVNIPGSKKDADGKLIPGSIEVTVYADEVGEEYNKGLVDFTVPGLLDSELYDKFYARSKTEMAGGFNGILKYASEIDVEEASQKLKEEVREKLLANSGFIGEDRILYDDAVFIDFSTHVPTDVSANGMLTIEETGLLRAFVFDKKDLSSAIANNTLSSYDGSTVIVRNLEEMVFVFEDKEDFDVNVSGVFTFTISGKPHIVWEIDVEEFKNDLAGISEG
ncbi:MAG: hypothetical protein KAS07_02110, partial [Candidatus Pacebacteria bacterium]|nr:hypothetical protein [Candidatus Paceibacterota bacterium]